MKCITHFLLLLLLSSLLACRQKQDALQPPAQIPIQNERGETISTQTGPLWVLISGVDEHGLIADPQVEIAIEPHDQAEVTYKVGTGEPAAVFAIQQSGPQSLHRFYQVQTLSGASGWVTDYYVRRHAYLYLPDSETISLFAAANHDTLLAKLPNVSPILLLDPTPTDWWQVQDVASGQVGWVEKSVVKESSSPEFLLRGGSGHDHAPSEPTHEH